ncbi:MAG: helix-turn-helix domain-containing protein, partial [Candidatus Eisenbacteria sp.]|nr:helix-turn-helix domain-containing protein [Candidatus Eisenbacteria bacterium]
AGRRGKGPKRAMPTKAELGHRLRVARFERNLTLKEVAARCGMSATHISEVERGKTSPTIGALQRITAALGEKTSYFVQEDELPRVKLTRLADRCELFSADAEGVPMQVQTLSGGIPGGYMQVFRQCTEPGSILHRLPRIGEAVVLCVAGMVRITALGESHVLREGDSIQLRLDDGYVAENIGDEESETITVLSAPTLVRV